MAIEKHRAAYLGQQAAWLVKRGGTVHSVFQKAVNLLVLEGGQEYLLSLLSTDMHEYSLTCPDLPEFSNRFQINASFSTTEEGLFFSGINLAVSTRAAGIWHQPAFTIKVDAVRLQQRLERAKRFLAEGRPSDRTGVLDRLENLSSLWPGESVFPPPGWLNRLQPLVGLGPGLTPLGDDYISGYLTAVFLFHNDQAARAALTEGAAQLAAGDTTIFSKTQIKLAGRGICLGSIFAAIKALVSPTFSPDSFKPVLDIGDTSGYGWLLGIVTAARHFSESVSQA